MSNFFRRRPERSPVVTTPRQVELAIKGDVEALRLEPGDRVIVTLDSTHISLSTFEVLRDRCRAAFPDNEVIVLANGLRLVRETHGDPVAAESKTA